MRVWHKLFMAIFTTSLLLVVITLVLTRFSFNRGFVDYLNTLDINRSQQLVVALQDHHATDSEWATLKNKRRVWGNLVQEYWQSSEADSFVKPPPGEDGFHQRPPPRHKQRGNRPPPRKPLDRQRRFVDLTFVDENGEYISGARNERKNKLEIPVTKNDELIGTLIVWRSLDLSESNSDADNQFISQQKKSLRWIALMATLFALLVSLLLSKVLLSPLQALSTATRKFADGDFSTRVDLHSKDEFGNLVNDFNSMATKLERHRDARRQWTADISHELRTPLTILAGEIQAIRDGIRPMNEDSISSLDTEISRLNKLVDDLYDLSLADSESMTYKKTSQDMRKVVEDCFANFKIEAQEQNLELSYELPAAAVQVNIDPDRMAQLINNLIKNSLRYTDAPGRINISLKTDQDRAVLSISDSAPGVTDADLPKIFQRLYRTDESRSRKNGGAGLGLSICHKIAEAHNGTLVAEHSALGGVKMSLQIGLV